LELGFTTNVGLGLMLSLVLKSHIIFFFLSKGDRTLSSSLNGEQKALSFFVFGYAMSAQYSLSTLLGFSVYPQKHISLYSIEGSILLPA
jgi:hypothetical protein